MAPFDDDPDLPWYTETLHDGFRTSIQVRRVLFDSETAHQRLVIAESVAFGKLVMLDGVTQLTTADEHVYHEMLSHVPILAHGAVREVLIVGGGDGGMIEEVFKHAGIGHVTMAELDAGVIELAKAHLPELSNGAFDDPRLEIVLGDGRDFVAVGRRRRVRPRHRRLDRPDRPRGDPVHRRRSMRIAGGSFGRVA